jgi:hypothetical protein
MWGLRKLFAAASVGVYACEHLWEMYLRSSVLCISGHSYCGQMPILYSQKFSACPPAVAWRLYENARPRNIRDVWKLLGR